MMMLILGQRKVVSKNNSIKEIKINKKKIIINIKILINIIILNKLIFSIKTIKIKICMTSK